MMPVIRDIHLLISYSPDISITSTVRRLKQKSTHELWNNYSGFLTNISGKNTQFGVRAICVFCWKGKS